MDIQHFNFDSEAEAEAFIRGIECVADESVEIEGLTLSDDSWEWIVTVIKHDDTEVCGKKYCECE